MSSWDDSDMSPVSSPASSPFFGPVDSSPPSSPTLSPLASSPPSPGIVHPFAASAKATRPPKLYEKREARRFAELDSLGRSVDAFDAKQRVQSSSSVCMSNAKSIDLDTCSESGDTEFDEHEFWEAKVSEAIDNGNGIIDLSIPPRPGQKGLTAIPPAIGDLANLVVLQDPLRHMSPATAAYVAPRRTMTRAATAPASAAFASSRIGLMKTTSFNHFTTGRQPNEIQLFLGNHQIASLPPQLFLVQGLVVLSLRGNLLTHIPPQIANLRNLRHLNICNNMLTFLPAEMLDMELDSLDCSMNKWMEPPPELLHPKCARIVSKTVSLFVIPTLKEYVHRFLLSPAQPSNPTSIEETVLEHMGGFAVIPDIMADHLVAELHICLPHIIPRPDADMHPSPAKRARRQSPADESFSFLLPKVKEKRRDETILEEHPGIGVCPNRSHTHKSVFVNHAEEWFTWEGVVAGQRACEKYGVPMKWRGCSPGCLAFLGPDNNAAKDQEGAIGIAEEQVDPAEHEGVEVINLDSFDDDSEFE
ncbi:unnamed protein product [Somion occarium]|uniref:Leucine rich repeat domain containing protein n=1 Tax=Somion occarium TaxID=3059160 RepID=A0ABP1E8K0_9APHY